MAGGMITYLLDSLYQSRIKIISMHHEQACAFAAEGYARMRGTPGVALATSGPGALNLLTGIGSCYFDSVPVLFITGQVNRGELKGLRAVRQLGFQETDIVAVAHPIVKDAWQVQEPSQIPALLECAFNVSMSGRRGPVILDIPMDVQRAIISGDPCAGDVESNRGAKVEVETGQFIDALDRARRPLILAGGGISSAGHIEEFRILVDKLGIPVVNSLMAVDVLPFSHPLRVGMIGTYGNRWANLALGRSDLLLVIGSRLDVRQTGSDIEAFKRGREIFHVDIEPGEINNRIKGCVSIVADLRSFVQSHRKQSAHGTERADWKREINEFRSTYPDTEEQKDIPGINPNRFMHALSQRLTEAAAYVTDVGQHQMWAAQSLELNIGQRCLTSGGMGSMGFALPAAIGAAVACGKQIVTIAGDGGFQCNIQELQTIAAHHLPIKMIVMNNRSLGMVRQFQDSYFSSRLQSTVWGYSVPDFVKVASAYGIDSRKITTWSEVFHGLDWLAGKTDAPQLLEVDIHPKANAFPKIAFGCPLTTMEPVC